MCAKILTASAKDKLLAVENLKENNLTLHKRKRRLYKELHIKSNKVDVSKDKVLCCEHENQLS